MGFTAAIAAVVVGGASYMEQKEANKDAARDREAMAATQREAQSEQKAVNTAQAAAERRQQIREERVKRARIIQASENTGVSGSSGEFGALGSLATNLGSNIGSNLGMAAAGGRISDLNQTASGFNTSAQNNDARAANAGQAMNLSMSIFNSAGGFNTIKQGPTWGQ